MSFLVGLNLMNFPEFFIFLEHIADNEFFVGIDHQDHTFGLWPFGEDERNVARGRWSKLDGVDVLTCLAAKHEIRSIPNGFFPKDFMARKFATRRTLGGVVEDFLLFAPVLVVLHTGPSCSRKTRLV